MAEAAKRLRRDHTALEHVYDELLRCYRSGSWASVSSQWLVFELALRAHMDREERFVFPAFRRTNEQVANELLAEHDELRHSLDELGVQVELHAVPMDLAEALLARLRAHARREELLLYPWMETVARRDAQAIV